MTPFDVTFGRKGASKPETLTAGEDFRFDIDRIEDFFDGSMPSPLIDLLRIGMAVYLADRLVRRRQRQQQRHWSREITLKVGVLEPDIWNTDDIRDCLIECIEFLSDDVWDISFEQDDRRTRRDIQRKLFPVSRNSRLCLYSGGLDSAAGLGCQIANGPDRPVIPITVWHQGGQRYNVLRQINILKKRYEQAELVPLIFKAHLLGTARHHRREEPTQRSRAFLFMAAGAAAAFMCRGSEVEVYESGVGAFNLPLMAGMTGSRTTRSAHPEFLRLMSHLASTVTNQSISLTLPFVDRTKGQLVGVLSQHGLDELAKTTVSCVSYPLRDKHHKQCGICPACVFRRQAMITAGIPESGDEYKHDLFSASDKPRQPTAAQLKHLKAFLMQVVALKEVRSGRRLPDRIMRHLMGTGILSHGQSLARFIQLFRQYRKEWLEVARQAHLRGYAWTNLLDSGDTSLEGASRASA